MNKNILLSVLGVVVVAAAIWGLVIWFGAEELASEKAAKLEIDTYSMEGKVQAIKDGQIVAKVGKVVRTAEGNKVEEYEQKVALSDNVEFSILFRADVPRETITRQAFLDKVELGDTLVFYGSGSQNRLGQEVFTATRVELIRR